MEYVVLSTSPTKRHLLAQVFEVGVSLPPVGGVSIPGQIGQTAGGDGRFPFLFFFPTTALTDIAFIAQLLIVDL